MRQPPPIYPGGRARWRRPGTALLTAALMLGTTLPALSLATASDAHADSSSTDQLVPEQTGPASEPAPPGTSSLPLPAETAMTAAEQQSVTAARAKAAKSGKPVVVDALTTQTSTVSAEASGKLLYESSVQPVRVRKGTAWTAIDTTLKAASGGGFAPVASPGAVVFSAGGTAPLATMAGPDGASLALTWPTALPAPSVEGSTLTYASVVPSVDLKVTATSVGGFSETLVVKTLAAAANPALSTLKLGTVAHGVVVSADANGNLTAATAAGKPLFQAPAPAMWDSSTTATPNAGKAVIGLRSLAVTADPASVTASTASAPGSAARTAPVRARLHDHTIDLVPDRALLTSKTATFPLFVDPSWTPVWGTASKQHFDEVQSGCPSTNHIDSTTYGNPGVGNNTYSGCIGVERSYYALTMPTKSFGSTVLAAWFNIKETYSASCSASDNINLYLAGVISSSTTWNHQPSTSFLGGAPIGPACTQQPSVGFNVQSTAVRAVAGQWSTITLGVFNSTETNSLYFKRFQTNPTLSIEYDHAPDQPSALDAKATGTDLGCSTASPYPLLGKTDSVSPITVSAKVSDRDADSTQTQFQYWIDGSTTKQTIYSVNGVASGGTASAGIPASYIAGLADGVVVDWQVTWIGDGDLYTYPTAPNPVCHFTMSLHSPTLIPVVTHLGTENTPSTVSVTSSDPKTPAVKIVYQLDTAPPTSNAPAYETLSGSQVVAGAATITVTPPGPGIHTLNMIGYSASGNTSITSVQLNIAGAPPTAPQSFASALNNTAISSESSNSTANADGVGESLSQELLTSAGWKSGQKVTVDGATFTLPTYGAGKDNILADNQTINLNNQSGSSLVVLAFGTFAGYQAIQDPIADSTVPHVPVGTNTAASDCTMTNGTAAHALDCAPASGTLNYTDTTLGSAGSVAYHLSVPDWTASTTGVTALSMPYRNQYLNGANTKDTSGQVNLYAFAIHLEPGKTLASITLPDVSGPAQTPSNTTGAPLPRVPALHILGMAVRNPTTDSAGNTWTGAWAAPAENQYLYVGGTHYTNLTWRSAIVPSVSGTGARIHLSNQQGSTPLTLSHATLATQSTVANSASTTYAPTGTTITTPGFSPVAASAPVNLTFGGSASVTIPAGGDLYSDPVTTVPIVAGKPLLVSLTSPDAPSAEGHRKVTDAHSWISASGSGDHTADTAGTAFTATGAVATDDINIISGLDTVTSGNTHTIAVLGDGLVAPFATGTTAQSTTVGPRLSDVLAAGLNSQSTSPVYGIVNVGIENNSLNTDASADSGRSALSRLDRDVLALPGLQTVVIDQGLVDVAAGQTEDVITTAYKTLASQLNSWGVQVIYTTLTPCGGYTPCTTNDARRIAVNTALNNYPTTSPNALDMILTEDVETAVGTNPPVTPETLLASNDAGDHINLKPVANLAIGTRLPITDLTPYYISPGGTTLVLQDSWALAGNDISGQIVSTGPAGTPIGLNSTTWTSGDPALPQADTTQVVTNPTGVSLKFNGANSYGNIGVGFINPTASYKFDAWVKLDALTPGTSQWAVSQGSSTQKDFALGYSGTTGAWTFTALNSGSTQTVLSGTQATAGTWTHLTAYYDATKATLQLFVGTAAATTDPVPFTPSGAAPSAPDDFAIGGIATVDTNNSLPTTISEQFTGTMSNLQIFTQA